ncbi:hypothetical protein WJX72_008052 [[Myrmecia] bisecta]|uniref:Serine/threonine-protein phosphatase n=1 Tax=[Myrmecia] bisecta TaxID=41462 RepID=A0AAW1PK98_9CHLO
MEPSNEADVGPILFDPQQATPEWACSVASRLEQNTWAGVKALAGVLPAATATAILDALGKLLKHEPTLVEVVPGSPAVSVTVVGDTHGQLHDVLEMLRQVGNPSAERLFVFNGDFVDRGAWGLETLMVLACWKLALPRSVVLLRGNHESSTCTALYGFRAELEAKYGKKHYKGVYSSCLKAFAALPLAALIAQATLVLHGGLFRKPASASKQNKTGNKRKRGPARSGKAPLLVGSLDDLRKSGKGGRDPNGAGFTVLATDVLWSDPVATPGVTVNDARGVGLIFGPDVTKQFLEENALRLILRSHEGPDARFKRDDMPSVDSGYALDHTSESGQLMTVFSAPDYPQFQDVAAGERYDNTGAVAVLTAPGYSQPEMKQFRAVLPRPQVEAYYEYQDVPDSDEEIELGAGPGVSDMSASELSLGGPRPSRCV